MAVKIFIPPGHGGKDPGAVSGGVREKDLTLKIADAMRDELLQYEGVVVKLSREDDRYIHPSEQARMANEWGADVVVSPHVNAGGGNGFESYVYPGVGKTTRRIQSAIHRAVYDEIKKHDPDWKDRGMKQKNYAILRETRMPAVLTETGFIDHPDNIDELKKDSFLRAIGKAHARGLAAALDLKRKPTPKPAPKSPSGGLWVVQAGAFRDRKNADALAKKIKDRVGVDCWVYQE